MFSAEALEGAGLPEKGFSIVKYKYSSSVATRTFPLRVIKPCSVYR